MMVERMVVVRGGGRDFFAGWSRTKKHAARLIGGEIYGAVYLEDVTARDLRVGHSEFHGHTLPAFVLDMEMSVW